jgi:hypothetical protein
MNKVAFVLAAFFGISQPGFTAGPGWTVDSKIIRVVVTATGGVNVRLSPDLGGCTSQNGYGPLYASIYPSHPGIDRIYSALLAASMGDKVVAIYLADNTCTVSEIRVGGNS